MGLDDLITKTDAKNQYGATATDLAAVEPAKQYYSRRSKCNITLYSAAAVEEQLKARYGSLETCKELSLVRSANARAACHERLLGPPPRWPYVGTLDCSARWAAVDTETTGLNPANGCRVVEVAVVVVEKDRVTREWSSRINPGETAVWQLGASEVNGIFPADVVGAPLPSDVWAKFLMITAGMPLVAHHAAFDRGFIAAELALAGLEQPVNDWYCTMAGRRKRLSSLYYAHAKRWINEAHTALADARAVAYLAPRVFTNKV
jgi:DNA polymerase-3 subunit epsilon